MLESLGIVAGLVLACTGVGGLLLSVTPAREADLPLRVPFAFHLGTVLLALAILVLGAFDRLGDGTVLIVVLVFGLLGARTLGRWARPSPRFASVMSDLRPSQVVLMAILAVAALLNLVQGLAPPTAGDTMAYHLAVPEWYLERGGWTYNAEVAYNAPLMQHALYVVGLALGGDRAALLVGWVQGLVLCGAIIGFAVRYLDLTAGLVAACVYYTAPVFTEVAASGYVEPGLALATFLAVWASVEWIRRDDIRWLALSGACAGSAAAMKYYGLATVAILGLLTLLPALRPGDRPRVWKVVRGALVFSAATALVAGGWYLRTAEATGNPLYPAFYDILGGRDWSTSLDDWFGRWVELYKKPVETSALGFVTLPFALTLDIPSFRDGPDFGPLYLALLPLAGVRWWRRGRERWTGGFFVATLFVLLFTVFWYWGMFPRDRHLLPAMPLVALGVGYGVAGALGVGRRFWRIAVTSVLAVGLAYHLTVAAVFNGQFVPPVIGTQDREAYLADQLWGFPEIRWINDNLPSGATLLHFDRTLNYYLEKDFRYATAFSQGRLDWSLVHSVEGLATGLREEGVTHVLVNREQFLTHPDSALAWDMIPRGARVLSRFLSECGDLVYESRRSAPARRTLGRGRIELDLVLYRVEAQCPPRSDG